MKANKIFSLLFGAMLCTPIGMYAQTAEDALDQYEVFVATMRTNGEKNTLYSSLYNGVVGCMKILEEKTASAAEYDKAKEALRFMYPYLPDAVSVSNVSGSETNALLFAQLYIEIPLMDAFNQETFKRTDNYAELTYYAAAKTFNAHKYEKAVVCMEEYLNTGDTSKRQDIFKCLVTAYDGMKKSDKLLDTARRALQEFPSEYSIIATAIDVCIENDMYESALPFIDKALTLKPDDPNLLFKQGVILEGNMRYSDAIPVFDRLHRMDGRIIDYTEHLSLCTYNQGVIYYTKSQTVTSSREQKRLKKNADEAFESAIPLLLSVVESEPSALKYSHALAYAYACLGGREPELQSVNSRLVGLGGKSVSASEMPGLMRYKDAVMMTTAATQEIANNSGDDTNDPDEIPEFSDFAKRFVEDGVAAWMRKDPYEKDDEYRKRVNEATRNKKVKELTDIAVDRYVAAYSRKPLAKDFTLQTYDANNESFLINSTWGDIVLSVPRAKNEAKVFDANWQGMQFRNEKFGVSHGTLVLESLSFVTPTGKTYTYDIRKSGAYVQPTISDISLTDIVIPDIADHSTQQSSTIVQTRTRSDVDKNIPANKRNNERTFALVMGNEHYIDAVDVQFASNDAYVFAEYCKKTLGLPDNNVRLYTDVTYGAMGRAIRDLKSIANAYNGDINVIVYYAGHGMPDEKTKDAFIVPVDADGRSTDGCYALARMYQELESMKVNSAVVFLDACFSGATRSGDMLAEARAIVIKPRKSAMPGNMVVFSAVSNDETALPYEKKGHGLFTYYLLKKLQESKGNATLGQIGDYIKTNVAQQSAVINKKPQTPTVNPSDSMKATWNDMKMRK